MYKTKLLYILLITLLIFQVFDGYFTYLGVIQFETIDVEGNPLIRNLMKYFGIINGLVFAKLIAVCFILMLLKDVKELSKLSTSILIIALVNIFYMIVLVDWYKQIFI